MNILESTSSTGDLLQNAALCWFEIQETRELHFTCGVVSLPLEAYTWPLFLGLCKTHQWGMAISGPQGAWMPWKHLCLKEFGPLSLPTDTVSPSKAGENNPTTEVICLKPVMWSGGVSMCLTQPLCKVWSRQSCKWLSGFAVHSPDLKYLSWVLPGDLPPQWPGFVQVPRKLHTSFLRLSRNALCVPSLGTRISVFVYIRGVLGPPV